MFCNGSTSSKDGSTTTLTVISFKFQPSCVSAFSRAVFPATPSKYVWMLIKLSRSWSCHLSMRRELMGSCLDKLVWPPETTLLQRKQHFKPANPFAPVNNLIPSASARMLISLMCNTRGVPSISTKKPFLVSSLSACMRAAMARGYPCGNCCKSLVRETETIHQHVDAHKIGSSLKVQYVKALFRRRSGARIFPGTASSHATTSSSVSL